MSNGANTAHTLRLALAAIALVLVLGFAPVACAAMVSQPQADSHPCCPKPGHADSNPCAKTGCVANVPALRAAPTEFGIVLPAVVPAVAAPAAHTPVPRRGGVANVPALRAAPTEFGIVLPAVVQAVAAPAARISEPERGREAEAHFSPTRV